LILGIVGLATTACGAAVNEGAGTGGSTVTGGDSVPTVITVIPNGNPDEAMRFPEKSFEGMQEVVKGATPTASQLPFAAAFPSSAGTPMGVFTTIPADTPAEHSAVIEEFDASSPYGPFRVSEEKHPAGELDQSFINQIPSVCSSTCTDARLVSIQPGVEGALLAGPDGPTSITWLQGSYEMIVIGPPGTFTPQTAVSIAKQVAAKFAPTAAAAS
jgi:hypothetical protein